MNDDRIKAEDLDAVRARQEQGNGESQAVETKTNMDSPAWRQVFARMAEDDKKRFRRHKAMLRGAIMKAFTETINAEQWNESDDNLLDLAVSWLLHLQGRAGVKTQVATEQTQVSTHDGEEPKF